MGFRESVNNLIRSDKPDSPTDLVFLVGMLILLELQIYATFAHETVPYFEAMLVALGSYKCVKVGSDYQKKRKASNDKPADNP
jgi:hypothetical protein